MRQLVALLWLAVCGSASALPVGTFQEQLGGSCNGTDRADGGNDLVPEALSLDLQLSHFSANCQMVGNILVNGSIDPAIDIQLSTSAQSHSAGIASEGWARGFVEYYFQVSGPAGQFVDVSVSAAASISGSSSGSNVITYSTGRAEIFGLPDGLDVRICGYFGQQSGLCSSPGSSEQSISYVASVPANSPYLITMIGTAFASASGAAGGAAEDAAIQVVLDPIFQFVNPEDAALYTLEFSPNMAPVPLPATALLLPTGLLALGARVRRRRQAT